MPIEEYACTTGAFELERKGRFGEADGSPSCPQGRRKVHQLFSPPAILFKGSGFYVTDSRKEDNRPPEKSKTDKVDGSKKEERKTDKVEGSKKEEGKADKVQSDMKSESK